MTTKRYLTISSDGIETLWFDKPMKYYDGHGNFKFDLCKTSYLMADPF